MGCLAGQVIELVERLAPPGLAEEWDSAGLQFGSRNAEVDAVLVALEVSGEVLREAIARKAGMVVCHHPPLFRPLRRLLEDEPEGALARDIVRSGLTVYAAHSSLDASPQGVNTALAEVLGLRDHVPLGGAAALEGFKLVTFLPPEHLGAASEALFRAGAGVIGDYEGCSFRTEGVGTFLPGPGSRPFCGEKGRWSEVREVRLEVWVEGPCLERAVRELMAVHPYEEPAIDIYPARSPRRGGTGRIGDLPRAMRLDELAGLCRRRLACPAVRFAGAAEARVRRVAVCGGRGGDRAGEARRMGADVLVTGDVSHHEALAALGAGLAVIDAGHYHTERVVVPFLARRLAEMADAAGMEIEVFGSERETCPWQTGGEG